jgi:hypothetical protein
MSKILQYQNNKALKGRMKINSCDFFSRPDGTYNRINPS